MDYSATITVFHEPEKLLQALNPELSRMAVADRSILKVKQNKQSIEFIINAKDSTALRAVLNSITKLLTVYEKVNNF